MQELNNFFGDHEVQTNDQIGSISNDYMNFSSYLFLQLLDHQLEHLELKMNENFLNEDPH